VITISGLSGDEINSALTGRRFDVVFHLAAYGVAPSNRDPVQTFQTNVAGTDAIIHAAAQARAGAVVYLGSCSEYRNPVPGKRINEDAVLGPNRLYGGSKAAAGLWGQALAAEKGVAFQWLRLFNVFGPGEAASRLIPALIKRLRAGEAVALSPGEQVRDFLYVDDAVAGVVLGAKAALEGKIGPFNLCSGTPVKVKEIALAVADALGRPYELLAFGALDYRPDDIAWLVGNPDCFQRATGFRPQILLTAGIEKMIAAEGLQREGKQ
jgi:nucleoside-diphosphate-sugar epimerase